MNKERRKRLADINEQLEELKSLIESLQEEEQEAFDNMPESLQESERGEIMQEKINNIENAVSSLEDAICEITEAQE